ncbi:sentrin-specific protease 5 [Sinocyclocheilus anshuiensis]|uniref:sentrin-specific protease 5 n=1 Tax=Sinocyclocheilus anshuiensis TaxID=1608454 RepID=UPI0007B85DB9|nr:PREDICTED: sentrin-specific protease 5-like [Sinocyclocheilus anshuiensis]XP_016315027.1 PREDICTED: sentrin-specific protease 5-like [Sinocyclocheilus anshuiensis]XP_016315028.1 PREDICTED: sentrin-specific protease 5-like [Sinocyclocheilus anshuiensis]
MRVPAANSSVRAESGSGEMPENGRSRRKRVPKTCDCCGPNGRPHALKKRGRKKKEMLSQEEEVAAEEVVSSAAVDSVVTLEADAASEMEEAPSPKGRTEGGSESTVLVNGLENSIHANCTHPCDNTELNDLTKKPADSEPDVCTHTDAMEAEPSSLSTNVNKASWDHHYCKPLAGENQNHSREETGQPSASPPLEFTTEGIIEWIHEFLEQFYGKYGSFTPLSDTDVLDHLNKTFQSDLNDRMKLITAEVAKYRAGLACAPMHFFQVTYNKHTLTLEDLSTLDDQNWVNDQVINMYGELIMEATNHKVHFFNSFFYRQFVAKGYEGVRRWTKKVDLFSKTLILIPLHLEIHWSLITLDVSKQSINIFDSQGMLFKFAVDNILKYILAEAKEKKQAVFQKGWKMVINRTIPQQKNDNDCGVFVLEYCKCLAFMKPLLFTQEDMPCVRKRIYRELCDCRLSGCLNQDKAS